MEANIIQQVTLVVQGAEPSCRSLFRLLKLGTPDFAEAAIDDETRRNRAFKKVRRFVHPDKNKCKGSTKLFQDVTKFYEDCVEHMKTSKRSRLGNEEKKASVSVGFQVHDKWPFLVTQVNQAMDETVTSATLAAYVSAQCLNCRGAIAHGQPLERYFRSRDLQSRATVQDIFKDFGGGVKVIPEVVGAIQEEIKTNGPVVSTGFRAWNSREALLLGWKGNCWLALPVTGNELVEIPFGQYGAERGVVAPLSTFTGCTFQSGPYIDLESLPDSGEWMNFKSMTVELSDASIITHLAHCLGGQSSQSADEIKTACFVIRNARVPAHSRTFVVRHFYPSTSGVFHAIVDQV